jgi:hypothetical protein
MNIFVLVFFGLIFHCPLLYSQNFSKNNPLIGSAYSPATGIKGSYLGSIIHPGFKLSLERPYQFTKVDQIGRSKTRESYKERYFAYSLGMYHHQHYHTNFFLQTEWIGRHQKGNGFFYESSAGIGISRTFVDGPAYLVTEEGEVYKVLLSGNWYGLVSVGASIGYNAELSNQIPVSIFMKHQWLVLGPYNGFITPRPTLEMGLTVRSSSIWGSSPNFKYKQRKRV